MAEGELLSEITALKELARDQFQSQRALRSPAHITLVPPLRISDDDRDMLQNRITSIASRTPRFDLQIKGVNGFPPRVIYADVIPHPTLSDLHRDIQSALKEERILKSPNEYTFRPHVTLAFRDLNPEVYSEALSFFQGLNLLYDWPVHQICRLKHHQDHWEIDHIANLQIHS